MRVPDAVIVPIVQAFASHGRRAVGRFVGGNTGAFWDSRQGLPVLSADAALLVKDLA